MRLVGGEAAVLLDQVEDCLLILLQFGDFLLKFRALCLAFDRLKFGLAL